VQRKTRTQAVQTMRPCSLKTVQVQGRIVIADLFIGERRACLELRIYADTAGTKWLNDSAKKI
jgi:hypothetical protein